MSDIQRFVFQNPTCSLLSLFRNEIQIHHNSLKYYCIRTTLIFWKTLNLQLLTLLLVFVPQVAVPTFPSQNLQKFNFNKYIFVNIIVLRKLWSNNHTLLTTNSNNSISFSVPGFWARLSASTTSLWPTQTSLSSDSGNRPHSKYSGSVKPNTSRKNPHLRLVSETKKHIHLM